MGFGIAVGSREIKQDAVRDMKGFHLYSVLVVKVLEKTLLEHGVGNVLEKTPIERVVCPSFKTTACLHLHLMPTHGACVMPSHIS